MKYKIIYSTGGSIMSNVEEPNSELSQKWIPVSNHKKKKEWLAWDISRSFRHNNREYAIISKSNDIRYLCYKSQSGMLWHLYLEEGYGGQLFKFTDCGLYSTSLLLDLNLQRKLCDEEINVDISSEEFNEIKQTTVNNSRIDRNNDGLFYNKLSPEKSYSSILESNASECTSGPYTIFPTITSELWKKHGIPECGGKWMINNNSSHKIYKYIRHQINVKMSQSFNDLGNEKELYTCFSGKVCIQYNSYMVVKLRYTVFEREIEDKETKYIFKLVYAKYRFIEDLNDSISLPKEEFREKEFITPLFITSGNNSQKDHPLINKVAAAGMYTCKVFEYIKQTHGWYNYINPPYGNISPDVLAKHEELIRSKRCSTIYNFIGEFMDKLWPFDGWDSDLDGVHTDLEENYKGKVIPRLGFEDFAGYNEITSVNELNTIIDNL